MLRNSSAERRPLVTITQKLSLIEMVSWSKFSFISSTTYNKLYYLEYIAIMLKRQAGRSIRQLPIPLTALPPTFLLPIRAQIAAAASISSITTTTRSTDPAPPPNAYIPRTPSAPESSPIPPSEPLSSTIRHRHENSAASRYPQLSKHTPSAKLPAPSSSAVSSPSQGLLLRALVAQSPHYITIHLHARPYMVTQGDIVRLPFYMRDVAPGTMLRFNRASTMGSRDITIRGGGPALVDTLSLPGAPISASSSAVEPSEEIEGASQGEGEAIGRSEPWIDERLYVCRAVVMGVESEPMRFLEKTKRRQRHVKTVKSKGRFTILRIVECRARLPEDGED